MWWPARAAIGDIIPLVGVLALSLALLGLAIVLVSPRFGEYALVAAGAGNFSHSASRRQATFRAASPQGALRRKEWMLLRRDPWLVSQTLMQMLYLIPPAVLLWHSFDDGNGAYALLVPVLVMAAGQLAGGLAWLAISGEDAPDLVATAPVPSSFILRAKVEAVLGVIAVVFTPLLAVLAFASLWHALVAACGIIIATTAATSIQLWFRSQAKRSQFRRRQVSSRRGDVRRGFFVDRLGGDRCGRLGKPVLGHRPGDPRFPCRPWRPLYGSSPELGRVARFGRVPTSTRRTFV